MTTVTAVTCNICRVCMFIDLELPTRARVFVVDTGRRRQAAIVLRRGPRQRGQSIWQNVCQNMSVNTSVNMSVNASVNMSVNTSVNVSVNTSVNVSVCLVHLHHVSSVTLPIRQNIHQSVFIKIYVKISILGEAHIICSMVIPEKAAPFAGTTSRTSGPVSADSRQ